MNFAIAKYVYICLKQRTKQNIEQHKQKAPGMGAFCVFDKSRRGGVDYKYRFRKSILLS
jgi:hypothetical protein